MNEPFIDPKKCKVFKIPCAPGDRYIHVNDKRAWWKKKRPLFFVPNNSFMICTAPTHSYYDLTKMFIKYDGDQKLIPLMEYCEMYI